MAEFLVGTFDRRVTAADIEALIGNPLIEEEDVA